MYMVSWFIWSYIVSPGMAWHLSLDSNSCQIQRVFGIEKQKSCSEWYQHESVVINYIRFSFIQHQNRIPIGWLSILAATTTTTTTPITTIQQTVLCVLERACLSILHIYPLDSLCNNAHTQPQTQTHTMDSEITILSFIQSFQTHCFPFWPFPSRMWIT